MNVEFYKVNDTFSGDIITNPPYSHALEFVEKSLAFVDEGAKVAMLLRLQFLEGIKRRRLFERQPPYRVYVFYKRITCAINGDFESIKHPSAMTFAWFVWIKGYMGETVVKWI